MMCESGGEGGFISGEDDSEAVKAFRLKKLLKKSSIFLIGMDGSGKSDVGEELATTIGYVTHQHSHENIIKALTPCTHTP